MAFALFLVGLWIFLEMAGPASIPATTTAPVEEVALGRGPEAAPDATGPVVANADSSFRLMVTLTKEGASGFGRAMAFLGQGGTYKFEQLEPGRYFLIIDGKESETFEVEADTVTRFDFQL